MRLVSAGEMRRLDELTIRQYGQPGDVLMERAGSGATEVLLAQFPHVRRQRVVIVAGKGNNGGDGFVIARRLRRAGVRAEVVLIGKANEVKGDAAEALAKMRRAHVPFVELTSDLAALCDQLADCTLVVDALFGTGLNAPVQGFHAEVIEAMNACGVPMFAVDIPSGLDADRGVPLGSCIQAEATATFGFAKLGQVVYPGVAAVGALTVVDIGIDEQAVAEVHPRSWLLEPEDVAPLAPLRSADSHKGTYGHALIVAGSLGHTGAALMAAHACCRSGAGLTTLAGPASLNPVLSMGVPEIMTAALPDRDGLPLFDERTLRAALTGKNVVVLGPGLGTHSDAEQIVRFCLAETTLPLVLDADALTCVARNLETMRPARGRVILTPHPGEMARLIGSDTAAVQANRPGIAREFATTHGCVLVLKGARSIIAGPNGDVWVNPTGNPGMASGGMGDVLSGVLGGLLAQGLAPEDAARVGVYAHGAAADQLAHEYAPVGYLASDVIREIPRRLAALSSLGVTGPPPRKSKRRKPAPR